MTPAGTSAIVAWAEGTADQETISRFETDGSRVCIVQFSPVNGGVALR